MADERTAPSAAQAAPGALARIADQPRVRELLERGVASGDVAHAYLFVGPPGSGKLDAALALAQCVVCPHGGDGSCEECVRVAHHAHPDVTWLEPGSVTGYLVEQVRELVDEAQRAPVRASARVFVLDRAELLRAASANALLKTIEEPPEGVVFVLCARSLDAVLPTIASRCQVVPFRSVPASVALARLALETGAPERDARVALAVTGTPGRARGFLASPSRRHARALVLRVLGELPDDDGWDVLVAAHGIADEVSLQVGEVRRAQEEALSDAQDYLSAKALKQLERAQRRELTAQERSAMMEVMACAGCALRDVLLVVEGQGDHITNTDAAEVVGRLAARTGEAGALRALAAVREAEDDLSHNVSAQLVLETMLLSVKEALACPR